MRDLIGQWYILLSQAAYSLYGPINGWIDTLQVPVLSAFLFGVLGSLSPCQMTGNLTAASYAAQRPGESAFALRAGALFTGGKMLAYGIFGALAFALGSTLEARSVPFVIFYRRLLGPAFILAGLYFLGAFRLRFSVGGRLSQKLQGMHRGDGAWGAGFLGFAVSFSFCPTLFLLFFGWVLPLSLKSGGGFAFPLIFGFGTAVPLLLAVGALTLGSGLAAGWTRGLPRWNAAFRRLAGVIFLLAGVHDTAVYNFL
ncbi:MAG: sulfite exporter TauE/SafE family protein [Candidatus Tectomicrobia bacterium]|uniref:Sulfite exporter TauE/SafE family protein n=1 Tax=Tectimicrobiota bacterium TaxID=2528274 RepID=A0A932MQ79_UNCTE|nr:sulfite exporter TauE/SafE family protein [Candidatus Tectomicrobia bacterium]